MGIPTLFRFDDTSAPTLNGLNGSLIDVLDACLVNGYGSKTALGWTKEYTNVNGDKAVYRASSGTRQYLRVSQTSDDGSNHNRVATFEVYETMSDVDTGTGKWATGYQQVSNVGTADARAWFIWGDEELFYFWTAADRNDLAYSSYHKLSVFGDMIESSPPDANRCVFNFGDIFTTGTGDNNKLLDRGTSYTWIKKDLAGTAVSTLSAISPFNTSINYGPFSDYATSRVGASGSEWVFTLPAAFDATGEYRGYLPGLYMGSISGDYNAGNTLATVDGSFLRVHFTNTSNAAVSGYLLVDGTTDWRA